MSLAPTFNGSERERRAAGALLEDNQDNPPTQTVTRAAHYNVSPGASPTFVAFSGTTSRLAVQFNTGGVGLGTIPYKITIPYRRVGNNPTGVISVGLRKAAGDTFTLIAQWPIVEPRQSIGLITINVEGANDYQMVANDKLSIEYPPDNTNTIEVACGTGLPSGFTSQQYTGSYAATTAPLAVKIVSRVLTPI